MLQIPRFRADQWDRQRKTRGVLVAILLREMESAETNSIMFVADAAGIIWRKVQNNEVSQKIPVGCYVPSGQLT